MFSDARKLIIQKIFDLKALIEDYEKIEDKEFTKNPLIIAKKRVNNLERTLIVLDTIEHKKIKDKNDALRRKVLGRQDTIKLKTVTKEGKVYAIVPIEILPKYLYEY